MYPILFEIGPFVIHSLWLFVAFGIMAGSFLFMRLAKRYRLKLNFLTHHGGLVILSTLISARLFFILFHLQEFNEFFSIFKLWDKGLSFWGALLGFSLSIVYVAKKYGESWLRIFDAISLPLLLGLLFGHAGAFLDGIAHGKATNLPWGITFQSAVVKYAVPIHPTQLYAFLYTFVLFFMLRKVSKEWFFKAEGFTASVTIWAYSLFRFLEEFFRGDDTIMLFEVIRISQLLAFAVFAFMTWYLIQVFRSHSMPGDQKIESPLP